VAHAHAPHTQGVPPYARPAYGQVSAMRPARRCTSSKPALDQVAIRPTTQEGGRIPEVLEDREATDGTGSEIDRLEAGCCSQAKARLIAEVHQG
jgi:hypothetical protein